MTPGWPLTHERFLWDIFDSKNDGEGLSEGSVGRWWRMWRNYTNYSTGTGIYENDEHWDSAYTYVQSPDGRGATSFQWNYDDNYSYNTNSAFTLNCSPP